MTTTARPDLGAADRALRMTTAEAFDAATQLLGPRLIAYVCGVAETRAVREWAGGERLPRDPTIEDKARLIVRVASFIADHDGPGVAQAWFQGLNPQLEDRSPARLLREGDVAVVGPEIIQAARAFVVGG